MRLFVMAVLWAWGFLPGQAAERVTTEFPFVLRDGFLWVKVGLAGCPEALDFLFDTGAASSVIHLEVAASLGFPLTGNVKARGVRGEASARWVDVPWAQLDGFALPRRFLAVDLREITDAQDGRIDGIIGADFFRGRTVQIDFRVRRVRILDPEDPLPAGDVLPLKITRRGICVALSVDDGKPGWFRLDTGCSSALHCCADTTLMPSGFEQTVAVSGNAASAGSVAVRLESRLLTNVPVTRHAERIVPGESGLAGLGILQRFSTVTIDTRNKRLILSGFRG